jgi:hypothetical protein
VPLCVWPWQLVSSTTGGQAVPTRAGYESFFAGV